MPPIRKILYAVKDPDATAESGVAKVAAFAKSCGASLELFHAVATPLFLATQVSSAASLESLRSETIEVLKRRLDKLAAIARCRRITVRCTRDFARSLRGALHVVFANNPLPLGLSYGDPFMGAYPTGFTHDGLRRKHREVFDRFIVDSDVPAGVGT